jgi:hypothetical protein
MISKIKSMIKSTLNGSVQMVSISGDNSTSIQCSGDITINGKTLVVNGETVQLEGKEIYITVEGNAGNISADICKSIEVAGDVTGKVEAKAGNIKCGNVGGDVKASCGNITCLDVAGEVKASCGNIKISKVVN